MSKVREELKQISSSSYENSDASSKGIVSSLTNFINFFMGDSIDEIRENRREEGPPPSSPTELLEKIKEDYEINNYLWTGDIYTPAFDKNCRFTDPTLSFVGTDQFTSNVQNIQPILDLLMEKKNDKDGNTKNQCQSYLLDISLDEENGYIQSRWNMVGKFGRLPWKPKIDVVGKTKFWYKSMNYDDENNGENNEIFKVYFYDEEWEMPASKALLQLITPDSSTDL